MTDDSYDPRYVPDDAYRDYPAEELRRMIREVLFLHYPVPIAVVGEDDGPDRFCCAECEHEDGTIVEYPCPTAKALNVKMGDTPNQRA